MSDDDATLEPVDLSGAGGDADAAVWFDRWVEARITDALEAAWPHDRPLVVAFTSDGQRLRRHADPGCGHVRCIAEAVGRALADVAAPWLFGADLRRPPATARVRAGAGGDRAGEVLVAPGRRWTATWYAAGCGRGIVTARAGVVELDGEVVTGTRRIAVAASPAARAFHRMLDGHPARPR